MAKREQRWRPDTCKCVFIQEVDDATGEMVGKPDRSHPSGGKCSDHSTVADARLHDVVLSENQAKNQALAHAREHAALSHTLTPEQKQSAALILRMIRGEGELSPIEVPDTVMLPGVGLGFEFDANRDLTITFVGLDPSKVSVVEAHIRNRHDEVLGREHRFSADRIRAAHKEHLPRE